MTKGYQAFGAKARAWRRKCVACRERWAQDGGICGPCRTEGRVDSAEEQRRRADQRKIREATRDHDLVQRIEVPRQTYTRVIDGVEYDVMWDGRVHADPRE